MNVRPFIWDPRISSHFEHISSEFLALTLLLAYIKFIKELDEELEK